VMVPKKTFSRPPIVAVLGHVDHGKTTLLDKIRKTRVAQKEAGGITQSIGAYQIRVKEQESGKTKTITFIDTPGHAAFSKMRARGAQVTDLVVLVVAANDGVMPQTIESIEHIRQAKVPFLVAINKIDLGGADPEKVKKQLADNGVKVEGHGGEIVAVPVSAKTGEGLEELMEMILLLAEMEDIKADPKGELEAVVIESKKDKRGSVGTVIVRNGTLKVGDKIAVEKVSAKVRGLIDENGKPIKEAEPGKPVEVLGFSQVPPVGAMVTKTETLLATLPSPQTKPEKIKTEEEKLKLILKADSLGSLEAVKGSLGDKVLVIHSGVGEISESDVFLAKTTQAEIIGYQVKVTPSIQKLGEDEGVIIKTYNIIYELLDYLEERITEFFKPSSDEEAVGRAKIIAQFERGEERIAGCQVLEGKIRKRDQIQLQREDELIGEAKITSMKHQKEKIREAKQGTEFGAIFSPPLDFRLGDMIISAKPIVRK
jgi:translation initiation factor IF-2